MGYHRGWDVRPIEAAPLAWLGVCRPRALFLLPAHLAARAPRLLLRAPDAATLPGLHVHRAGHRPDRCHALGPVAARGCRDEPLPPDPRHRSSADCSFDWTIAPSAARLN